MKWLKSTTNNSYTALGKVIPPVSAHPIQVTESEYEAITKMTVIKSLLSTGGILVLDKYTESVTADSATRKLQNLTMENAKLADRIRELEAKTTPVDDSTKQRLAETEKALVASEAWAKGLQDKYAESEIKLAALKAKYEALEKEANEKIAALSAEKEAE